MATDAHQIITVKLEFKLPSLPNFIVINSPDKQSIDIADLDDDALKQIGHKWTEALLELASKRREP